MKARLAALARILKATLLYYTQALSVELVYRFALFQSFLGMSVVFTGLMLFWLAASQATTNPGTYTSPFLVAYFVIASVQAVVMESRMSFNLSMAIRMGRMSTSMLRPYPWLISVYAQSCAHATVRLLIGVVLCTGLFLGIEFFGPVVEALGPAPIGWYLLTLVLGLVAGWMVKTAIGLLAFDLTQT